ncbi:NAD(P)H-hydrate dehydratase [Novosphingobium cyanobacteriorum]|uniref:Bifunctional NAD(P)H-hydrate repair enzyme n=1 Tax=Novosphingobium cyanobacteriorum TaxID=3024215 RepID=A0ABT6CJ53_9SPHN|nr:NAD(P)H-hydrate dehydratase [Novosphingobium cyanobacteriorum]MDF8333922.1 NAD(P)H-hydrate dehydratase [Novosphingobium cyanobacteriorum]
MPLGRSSILAQVLSVAQMRAAEEALFEQGTSVEALMETAGRGAGEYVRRIAAGRPVTVLCGPGKNGGDGYVIARHLMEHGTPVRVVAAADPATPAARNARGLYQGEVLGPDAVIEGEVLIDCLFGSGLTRPLSDSLLGLLRTLAENHHLKVAVDLPSGVESDSGACLNAGLPRFDLTVALSAWKHAHFAMPACETMGALRLFDIGVAAVPGAAAVLTRPLFTPPPADAHKYRRGLLGIVAGEMPGAPLLSAEAAMRAGAGYVKLFARARPAGVPNDLVCHAGPDADGLDDPRIAALLVGPGLGRSGAAAERLQAVLELSVPVVVDADALVLLGPGMMTGPAVLTPHEGEMAALERAFGLSADAPKHARALALAQASGAVVLFKGPDSVIAAPDGRVLHAPRAPSWLSVAGTGDVLAGITASRLAVHRDPFRAASEGLWLHGEAARRSGPAFTAGDLARTVSKAFA